MNVYDINGKRVATLFDGVLSAGTYRHEYAFSGMASGVYYLRLVGEKEVKVIRMVHIR